MTSRQAYVLPGVLLLGGVIIGMSLTGWANAPATASSDELSGQLISGDSAMSRGSDLLARIARVTTPSVVHIQCIKLRREESGSGVIITSPVPSIDGPFVVTNFHVIRDTELGKINIRLYDGRVVHPIQEPWADEATDVAVLKIDAPGVQAVRWGDSNSLEIGHMVLALGSPFGLQRSVTFGIVSAKSRRSLKLGSAGGLKYQDFLQTDAAINPGNSGGPLVNLRGEVVGINTAIASNSGGNDGIGFSIPSNLVRMVAEQLLRYGRIRRAYIGVTLDEKFVSKTALRLKLDRLYGAHVTKVHPDTPAARAGLKVDDVILTFDGVEVQDENHLITLAVLAGVGKTVKLNVWRSGAKTSVDITLIGRPNESAQIPTRPGMGTEIVSLGLAVHEITPALAKQIGFHETTQGLLVLQIDPDSLMRDRLQLYDVIEEVSRYEMETPADLQDVLDDAGSGSLLFKIKRHSAGQSSDHLIVVQLPPEDEAF